MFWVSGSLSQRKNSSSTLALSSGFRAIQDDATQHRITIYKQLVYHGLQ